ncbi:unnamed protein product [Acanthoscelides obtectus]|uniref:Ubiquitin-like domain-containing protein n=1 Tax=Acanthoscelides obtectus TaxID=200917 RepID=A0A9P0LPB0_ACAOB|nr:unnamed protein product [Acanthoscelides obtectus]CAK1634992.1 Tubulin-folding cofactor B [Acanthoscelides obtectus]
MSDLKVITGDFVNLQISTSKDDISFNEKRFPKDLTISDLKVKLELITGGNCNTMKLEAYTEENKFVCHLDNDKALLGSYPLENGMRLHVIDQFQIRNELDFADVPKYELSQEEYDSKSDSVRAFLQKNKLGRGTYNICFYESYNDKVVIADYQYMQVVVFIEAHCLAESKYIYVLISVYYTINCA